MEKVSCINVIPAGCISTIATFHHTMPLTKCLLGNANNCDNNDRDGNDREAEDEPQLEKIRVGCHLLVNVEARHRMHSVDLVLALCSAVAKHGDDAEVVTQAFWSKLHHTALACWLLAPRAICAR